MSKYMNGRFFGTERTKDILILAGCVSVFLALVAMVYPKFAFIGTDGVFYALLGKSLAEGAGLAVFGKLSVYFSPFFSFSIVPFYWIAQDIDLAAHAAMIFFSAVSLMVFYFAARFFTKRHVAAIATFFLAVNHTFVWKNLRVVSQPMASFLSILLFYFLVKFGLIDKKSPKVFLFSAMLGGVAGMLSLTRPEYFFIILPLLIFVFLINKKEVSFRRNLAITVISLATFCVFTVPYIFFLHGATGQWSFMATSRLPDHVLESMDILRVNAGIAQTPVLWENQIILVLKRVFSVSFAKNYLENLLIMEKVLLATFGAIGFIFFGLGIRRMVLAKKYKIFGAVAVSIFPLFALALGHTGENGYLMPYLFLFILFIGIGCSSFVDEITETFSFSTRESIVIFSALAIVTASYFSFPLFQNLFFMPSQNAKPIEYQMIGKWFQDTVKDHEKQVILARKPEIVFYSGAIWEEMSETKSPDELVEMMHKNNFQYLALDTRSLKDFLPKFIGTDGRFVMKDRLELVKEVRYYDQHIYLYRLINEHGKNGRQN